MSEPYQVFDYAGEAAWREGRLRGIGGSDAAAVVGRSPYKTNRELFEEKAGIRQPEDILGKECVMYGRRAEAPLRELFSADHPWYRVEHHPYRILQSRTWPFLQASLDGELTDPAGRRGILEIKTTTIRRASQRNQWDDRIPDPYYIQILHYLLVTGFDFAVVCARLVSQWGGVVWAETRHHTIERSEVEEDLAYLLQEEKRFWEYVEDGRCPPLKLPDV